MKKMSLTKQFPVLLIIIISYLFIACQSVEKTNLENTTIILSNDEYSDYQKTVAEVLTAEVKKRTGFDWTVFSEASDNKNSITLSIDKSLSIEHEGYHLKIEQQKGKYRIEISSSDKRGLLYGAGKFLRMLEWGNGFAHIPNEVDITSSPQYPIRGHETVCSATPFRPAPPAVPTDGC